MNEVMGLLDERHPCWTGNWQSNLAQHAQSMIAHHNQVMTCAPPNLIVLCPPSQPGVDESEPLSPVSLPSGRELPRQGRKKEQQNKDA